MTAQEERTSQVNKLVLEIQNGNTDLLPVLWEAVENFIRFQASHRMRVMIANSSVPFRGTEVEDYVQQGYFALLKAIEGYNQDAGAGFTTYLAYHLKTAFSEVDGIRTEKRDGLHNADSLNEQIFDDEQYGGEKIDFVPDPRAENDFREAEDRIFIEDLHGALERAIDALPLLKREIIKGKYFKGHSAAQIAAQQGLTEVAICGQERAALREMQRQAKKSGLDRFVEMNTVYYSHYGLNHMRQTGESPVEAIVRERDRLRKEWLSASDTVHTTIK